MNRVILMGRLTDNPVTEYTAEGYCVSNFKIAIARKTAMANVGEKVFDYVPCVAWGKTAETIGRYMVKDKAILVEGSNRTRHYTDKNGEKHSVMEVVVEKMSFVGYKDDAASQKDMDIPAFGQEEAANEQGFFQQ